VAAAAASAAAAAVSAENGQEEQDDSVKDAETILRLAWSRVLKDDRLDSRVRALATIQCCAKLTRMMAANSLAAGAAKNLPLEDPPLPNGIKKPASPDQPTGHLLAQTFTIPASDHPVSQTFTSPPEPTGHSLPQPFTVPASDRPTAQTFTILASDRPMAQTPTLTTPETVRPALAAVVAFAAIGSSCASAAKDEEMDSATKLAQQKLVAVETSAEEHFRDAKCERVAAIASDKANGEASTATVHSLTTKTHVTQEEFVALLNQMNKLDLQGATAQHEWRHGARDSIAATDEATAVRAATGKSVEPAVDSNIAAPDDATAVRAATGKTVEPAVDSNIVDAQTVKAQTSVMEPADVSSPSPPAADSESKIEPAATWTSMSGCLIGQDSEPKKESVATAAAMSIPARVADHKSSHMACEARFVFVGDLQNASEAVPHVASEASEASESTVASEASEAASDKGQTLIPLLLPPWRAWRGPAQESVSEHMAPPSSFSRYEILPGRPIGHRASALDIEAAEIVDRILVHLTRVLGTDVAVSSLALMRDKLLDRVRSSLGHAARVRDEKVPHSWPARVRDDKVPHSWLDRVGDEKAQKAHSKEMEDVGPHGSRRPRGRFCGLRSFLTAIACAILSLLSAFILWSWFQAQIISSSRAFHLGPNSK
jgi:hypothetical protein